MPLDSFILNLFSMILIYFFVFVIIFLTFTGIYGIFKKVRLNGLKVIIPIYNFYIFFKIAGIPGIFSIFLLVPFINILVYVIFCLNLAKAFNRSYLFGVGICMFPTISFCLLSLDSSAVNSDYKFKFLEG